MKCISLLPKKKNGASRSINETLANYLERVDLAEVQTPAL